jgi:glycosyltransferase involved in cell wall biosynthesis
MEARRPPHRAVMDNSDSGGFRPLISVVLTTRDRPGLLSVALACYRHQTYARRELVVVDDGEMFPAEAPAVEAAGGRLVRVPSGTALGIKLNRGLEEAGGAWCQKMDDDDWYGPSFLECMVAAVAEKRTKVCGPLVAFVMPFLFFEVARWEIRRSMVDNIPGATLLFAREDWQQRPFRPLSQDEDVWFLLDQIRSGAKALSVRSLDSFLAVRHRGSIRDRGHTWVQQSDGRTLETYLRERPLYRRPEEILPEWAIAFYRDLREELLATA